MSLSARLARLELALGPGDDAPALVVLSADGIHDADGLVINLPAVSGGVRSVILKRGPEPAPTRPAAPDPHPDR